MAAACAVADVFVMPGHEEYPGLAVNEVMNLAKPMIVSNSVGCGPDLVRTDNGDRP